MAWIAFTHQASKEATPEPRCIEETGCEIGYRSSVSDGNYSWWVYQGYGEGAAVYRCADKPTFFEHGHEARDWVRKEAMKIAGKEDGNVYSGE